MKEELLKRYPGNPILTYRDVPFHANAVYNPGAVKFGDEYILVPRVEDGRRDNRLHVARSSDGIHFTIEPEPIYIPGTDEELAWENTKRRPRDASGRGLLHRLLRPDKFGGRPHRARAH